MATFGDFSLNTSPSSADFIVGYNSAATNEQRYPVSSFFSNVNAISSYRLNGNSVGTLVRNSSYSSLSSQIKGTFDYFNSQATYAIPGGLIIKGQSPSYDTSIRNLPNWGVYGLHIENVSNMDPGTTFVNDGRGNSTHAFTFRAGVNNFTSGSDHSHVQWAGAPNNPSQAWQMIQGGQNGAYDNRFMVHTLPQYQLTTQITAQNGGFINTLSAGIVTGTDRLTGVQIKINDPAGTNNYQLLGVNDYVGLIFNPGVAGLAAASYNGRVISRSFTPGLSTITLDLYVGVSSNWTPALKAEQEVSLSARSLGGNPGINYITSTIGEPSTNYVGLTGNYRNLPKHVLARFTTASVISGFKTGAPITLWVPNGMTPSNLIYGGPSSPNSRYGFFDAYVRTVSGTDMEIVLGSLLDQYNFNTYSNNVTAAGNAGWVLIGGTTDTVHRPTFGTTGFYFEREPWTSGSTNWLSGGLIKNAVLGCSESFGRYSYGLGHRGVTMGNYSGTFAGDGNIVYGNNSVAIGGNNLISSTNSNNQVVMGTYNSADSNALLLVGNGTSESNRSNVLVATTNTVYVNGDIVNTGFNATGFISYGAELVSNQTITDAVLDIETAPITSPYTMIRPTAYVSNYSTLSAVRLLSAFQGSILTGNSYLPGFKQTIVNYLSNDASHFRKNIVIKPAIVGGTEIAYYYMSGGNLTNSTASGPITLSAGYKMELIVNADEVGEGIYFVTALESINKS